VFEVRSNPRPERGDVVTESTAEVLLLILNAWTALMLTFLLVARVRR
jgi:hypothetical protein